MRTKLMLVCMIISLISISVLKGQDCPAGALSKPKGNKIFLYFPTTADNTYPEHGITSVNTSPLAAFDVSDLDATIGTTDALRNRIFQMVTNEYCEFNVEVVQTTTMPSPTEARWQIIGIGSDGTGIGLYGEAQDVDIGDADAQDYARIYAGTFEEQFTGTGEALEGANSTLERWARAIASTSAHEAGHNYGLSHSNANPRPGTTEDARTNHIMISGGLNSGESRAGTNKHFSDQSYEILAHNIGLTIKTLYNWDFVNPNDVDAHSLELTLLSAASSLSIGWWYNGTYSPWRDPALTNTGRTVSFQGTSYNEFTLTFSVDKTWANGSPGIAPPGVKFHIGASFTESDAVIVYDNKLKDSGGNELDLHPRFISFDVGSLDLSSGDFSVEVVNPDEEAGDLIIRNFEVHYLPRIASIETMMADSPLLDFRGLPIISRGDCSSNPNFEIKDSKKIHLGKLSDERYVDLVFDSTDCERGLINNGNGDIATGDIEYCPHGNALSLFPSTSVYITANVIDPNARYFDPEQGEFVEGPLESKVFYQFAGIVPDLNENGVDDLIDIREGTAEDENGNGVVDNAEPDQGSDDGKPAWWVYVVWVILFILIVLGYYRKRMIR